MTNIKDDSYYLAGICRDIDFIIVNISGISKDELEQNEILLDSMQFRLIQISESANKLSDAFKKRHRDIEWHEIYGLRNWLVHDYGNVDYGVVYETLVRDMAPLKEKLLKE